MLIARVIGSAVATIKDEKLVGRKLLIVRRRTKRGAGWKNHSSPSTR